MTEINYWAFEEAWESLMNSRIQYEENWQMARRQWRNLFYLISDKKYNDRMYGNGGGGGGSSSGRTGTNESGNGVLNFKNGDDKMKENVNKSLGIITLLAKILGTVKEVTDNIKDAKINVYFFSEKNDNNTIDYYSEFGSRTKSLTEYWNNMPFDQRAALIIDYGKNEFDILLCSETFSVNYLDLYTPFILLDELMHASYDMMDIPSGELGVLHHQIFYNNSCDELRFNNSIFINSQMNNMYRDLFELYYDYNFKNKE
ncbi:MAG TPA: hypothetical protein PKY56_09490 [Candidatus Kapabacteria bacterium]|nr:hypothetical protein [Candidatus Kapabacteria bacterium]